MGHGGTLYSARSVAGQSRFGGDGMTEPVIVVAGPTASGKSALALSLAEQLPGTVINADSMQVYRELSVLTARPEAAALARAPHRLYGVLPAAQACSAAQWRALALAEIAAARHAGRAPIVTGGTGLYINALIHGLAAVPDIPDAVRRAARARLGVLGPAAFHGELAARDPAMAARLRPSDGQRLVRAWEVIEATGRSLAEWRETPAVPGHELRFLVLLLMPPRLMLHQAVDARLWRMVGAGALAEVRALMALHLDPAVPAMKALGVPELAAHLTGELTLAEAVAAAQAATRRYVKRQATWFRHRLDPGPAGAAVIVSAQYSDSLSGEIFPKIRQFILTGLI
jgi:tRNA dimethylallyltransferase